MPKPGFNEDPLPPDLREFGDFEKTRKLIYDNAYEAMSKRFPIEDDKYKLELTNLRYEGPQQFSWAEQKRAMLTGRSLKTPMKGTWRLIDKKTGNVIDEKDEVVMSVPYYTERSTIINNGNDYIVNNQSRLKPGVYARTKRSGEHEAHFNIKPGTGRGFRLWLEPSTGIFRVNVGQANIPAYPFMKAIGISDEELAEEWGKDLLEVNKNKNDSKAIDKLFDKFSSDKIKKDARLAGNKQEALKAIIASMELDPWIVERSLGLKDTTNVTPQVLLKASKKLLDINRGDAEDDDRDHPAFSTVMSVEDFIKERIEKDAGRTARQLLFKIRRKGNLSSVGRGALDTYITSLIHNSGLVTPLEETNPISILDQTHRQIKFGEGGLGDEKALTDEARDVNPGQVGFIDLVASSESVKVGADLRYAYKTFKGKDGKLYAEMYDNRGKKVYVTPEDVFDKVVAFPGQINTNEVYALKRGKVDKVPRDEVDYFIPSNSHMYNPGINLVPMSTAFMPSRAFYMSKYWSQFMPVVGGEAPLVKSMVPGTNRSFHEYYGRKIGAINSKVSGVVSKVTDDGITILDDKGNKTFVGTIKNFPYNRLTALSFRPVVKEGDVVKPGDMLAASNFTDDNGELNMGRNLKTAILPARGHSFQDAFVISESAAKKLATEKLIGFDVAKRNGVEVSFSKYVSAFPSKYTKQQLENIDQEGVIKKGTIVNKGDPLILATGPKLLSAQDLQLGRLHKTLRNTLKDESVTWEMDQPGVVTDVAHTAKGAVVNVKSQGPAQVGDKLTTLFSSKGVISKIVPDDEMPRDTADNQPYEVLFNPMSILSRVAPNHLVELALAKIAKKTGKPYILPDEPPEEGWAEFAKKELEKHGVKESSDVYDPITGKTIKNVGEGIMYIAPFHHLSEKKLCVTLDTEFRTTDGWVKGSDLKPTHKLLTINPVTGEESWQFPTAINFYCVDGQTMYSIEDNNQDLLVTSGHRVVVDPVIPMFISTAEKLEFLSRKGLI